MRSVRSLRGSLRAAVRTGLRRARDGWRATATRTLRLTGAAMAAYLVALGLLPDPKPLLAALTALLIVQVTLAGTIADTVRRIISVFAGVAVAIAFSALFGFNVVSLALLITAALLVGQALRLGPHLLEVPISAMLILGVNGAESAAVYNRLSETVVGAVVGLLVNVVFPPAVRGDSAGAAIERFARRQADLLDRVADDATKQIVNHDADEWLAEARILSNSAGDVDRLLRQAAESRRLNPRALSTTDTGPDLRYGLDALEHSAVALRAVYRSIADRVRDQAEGEQRYPAEVRAGLALTLRGLGRALRAFGALVWAEADGRPADSRDLSQALAVARDEAARLSLLMAVDPNEDRALWELNGSILAAVERVLSELDVEARAARLAEQRRLAALDQTVTEKAIGRLRRFGRRLGVSLRSW